MTIEILEQLDSKLLDEWQSLWEKTKSAQIFNSPGWLSVCLNAFPTASYRLVILKDRDKLRGIIPFYIAKKLGVKYLISPGNCHLAKSTLLLADGYNYLLPELTEFLTSKSVNFYLPEVNLQMFNQLNLNRIKIVKASETPYIQLDKGPLTCFSKKQKNKIKGLLKKYGQFLKFVRYSDLEGLQIAYLIEQKSTKRKDGRASLLFDEERRFFSKFSETFPKNLTVDVLFYENTPVVYSINYIYKNIFQAVKTAYDENFKFLSPGKLILFYMLKNTPKEVAIFDFGRGRNTFKKEFTPLYFHQYDLYFSKNIKLKLYWSIFNQLKLLLTTLISNEKFHRFYLKIKRAQVLLKTKLAPKSFNGKSSTSKKAEQQHHHHSRSIPF